MENEHEHIDERLGTPVLEDYDTRNQEDDLISD